MYLVSSLITCSLEIPCILETDGAETVFVRYETV